MKIALCGNPNVGKTTLFNRLTRSDAPVGNWHGVTVDVRTKRLNADMLLSDLPGAYSLTARTAEEAITVDSILYGDHDVIVYVAEVNNLRRNLYMLAQLIEANKRLVLVVNMMDEARGEVRLDVLSKRLGIPVVGTSSKRENPRSAIVAAVLSAAKCNAEKPDYLKSAEVVELSHRFASAAQKIGLPSEFVALKITERDGQIMQRCGINACDQTSCGACVGGCACGADNDLPARLRYRYIDGLLDGIKDRPQISTRTRKIDKIVLGKLALPVFLAVMAAVFVITFEVGKPLSDMLSGLISRLCVPVRSADMPPWAASLLCDGVISGVGAVLAFLPQVVLLFVLTAVLQDSGYMSRVAFVTDDFFKKFGLSGRAAFSVILGLGCSATAVLTTRGIAGKSARRRAAFATSFCPCSARLAVFTAITAYFGLSGFVVAAMYLLGFCAALSVLKIMQLASKRAHVEEDSAMIMEMPPYRLPQLKRVASVVFHNVLSFVSRVGSVVLGVSVIMWVLCNFSVARGFVGGVEASLMHTVSDIVAPIFAPIGFGNWRAVTALISGIAAKETVISVIASLGGMGEVFASSAAAVSFMIFTCLYVPCVATLSALAKENGFKSALLSVAVHTAVAYIASLVYYRFALLLTADRAMFWTVLSCAIAIAAVFVVALIAVGRARIKRRSA